MILVGPPKNRAQKFIRGIFASFAAVLLAAAYFLPTGQPVDSTAALPPETQDNSIAVAEPSEPQPALITMQEDFESEVPVTMAFEVTPQGMNVLFEKEATKQVPVASLTKLMTALVAVENYDLARQIVITDAAMAREGAQGNLQAGELLTVKDLLYIMLMESSNRAAYALTEAAGHDAFVVLMNERASRLGLTNTRFADSTGLSPDSYSTAHDILTLSTHIFTNYPLLAEIMQTKEYDMYTPDGQLHHRLVNTNKLLGQAGIIGGKTGWTQEAKGCFVAIMQSPTPGNYIFSVVLGSDDRFGDMEKIITMLHQE